MAHDAYKDDIVGWVRAHLGDLAPLDLFAAGTTGRRPGNDAQIGAIIAQERLDTPIFHSDPLSALPQDVDVRSQRGSRSPVTPGWR